MSVYLTIPFALMVSIYYYLFILEFALLGLGQTGLSKPTTTCICTIFFLYLFWRSNVLENTKSE